MKKVTASLLFPSLLLLSTGFLSSCQATRALPQTYTDLSTGMEFVLIPSGTFYEGSDSGLMDEQPVHTVSITESFYLGKFEVIQAQWKELMRNPSHFNRDENRPVERVSWSDAAEFIHLLNQREGCDCYRLPTEAEWEYAARAGTTGNYPDDINAVAWYKKNAGGQTSAVGRKAPNAWGLYDMLGNVSEWVSDWYGTGMYPSGSVENPKGSDSGFARSIRGGNWNLSAGSARPSRRDYNRPEFLSNAIGFRLVREVQ